jgi:hypothetical protein
VDLCEYLELFEEHKHGQVNRQLLVDNLTCSLVNTSNIEQCRNEVYIEMSSIFADLSTVIILYQALVTFRSNSNRAGSLID